MIEFFEFLNTCTFFRAVLYLTFIGAMTIFILLFILDIIDIIFPDLIDKKVKNKNDILDEN